MENGQKIIGIIVEMIREKADPMRMAERYLHDILEKSFIDEADVAALALLLLRVSRGKKCGSDCCERGGKAGSRELLCCDRGVHELIGRCSGRQLSGIFL